MKPRWEASYWRAAVAASATVVMLSSCGGGSTGNDRDSGPNKTTLRVEASDADGDTLHYQWRVTGGTVENRDARETVWTLPDSPGLHFAYVIVSDGKGGYAEQQYAVSSDALDQPVPVRTPRSHTPPPVTEFDGSAGRLRFVPPAITNFVPPAGGAAVQRLVFLPDVTVQVVDDSSSEVVHSGLTDAAGEVHLPKLVSGRSYTVRCSSATGGTLATCGSFIASGAATVRTLTPALGSARNLRLHGHVDAADGSVCGTQNDYFGLQSAATVTLLNADGTAAGASTRVNRFGDYALDAAVAVNASLKLRISCEGESTEVAVPAAGTPAGYVSTAPVELSHRLANRRPTIAKMVANGPDGNVRGRMVYTLPGSQSLQLPGAEQFLTYKGRDSKLSACMYYRALGAAADCDAQGNMVDPIDFEDWKRANRFVPYAAGNTEVKADYINKMDLNLVRRMVATKVSDSQIAFYVCNSPGPDGSSQTEIDDVMNTALNDGNRVACVAMEWSSTGGANNGQPFTKFYTFGPDGALLMSVNLDGRGEKFMPGACVACHGGTQYNGRFTERGNPSPYLGSGFLPFDTNNYYFSSTLGEAQQSDAIHALNMLVKATEPSATTAVSKLIDGWYAAGGTTLNKNYVPPAWLAADAQPATAGAARLYHEVIGASCRTCHASMGPNFDWDSVVLTPARARSHVCGGSADVAINASMPNALISRDRVAERIRADASLAALTTAFLGCSAPLPDPAYPKR